MSFTEPAYFLFLVASFFGFCCLRNSRRGQIAFLTAASYFFYGWWDSRFVFLMLGTTAFNYFLARRIACLPKGKAKSRALWLSVAGNLGALAYFKYANFFLQSLVDGLSMAGVSISWTPLQVLLPLGISFYTFQAMSYTIDVFRGRIAPVESFLEFLFFISAFPQLVAGPIVRARDFLPQLRENLFVRCQHQGLLLILYGLAKKLLLADILAVHLVNRVFGHPDLHSFPDLILAVYGFTFQIYFDFSAYTDIAIGTGMLFGLQFPENFNQPFLSRNPNEFWSRWHISLSSWIQDYVFQPLALKSLRYSEKLFLLTFLFTFFLSGLWHGANWTFVVWGCIHGIYLILYHVGAMKWLRNTHLQRFVFFHLVCFSFIFFRAESLTHAGIYLKELAHFRMESIHLDRTSILLLLLSIFVHHVLDALRTRALRERWQIPWFAYSVTAYGMFLALNYLEKLGIAREAFIYFQF